MMALSKPLRQGWRGLPMQLKATSPVASLPPCCFPRRGFASAVSAAELQFGQPVHETHPHILKPGEITPGITAQEYFDRRAALAQRMAKDDVAILASADLKYRSGAVFHPYRQESDFLYLTGWAEADSLAVIHKTGDDWGDFVFHLYCQPKDPVAEQWEGPRNGIQAAEDVFNADVAGDINKLPNALPDIARHAARLWSQIDDSSHRYGNVWSRLLGGGSPSTEASSWLPQRRLSLRSTMNSLRAIKSPAEMANMRKAGQVSGRVITEAMRHAWTREKDLHAFLDYRFTADGCDGPAYIPVVGGGAHASCIHYTLNNNVLHNGELVLVDAGGEYGTYVTDITRTWPVNGRFSPAQRDLYEAVLTVQREGVALCRENAGKSLDDIHRATSAGILRELKKLGFDIVARDVDRLFPHHVGHYIGLDIHDIPGYGRREALKTGHCVTIEPGVYVPDDERYPSHFRGLGVRIEDSVCVEKDSPFILTTEAVKEIVDIEALRD